MALSNLAASSDLSTRGVVVTNTALVAVMLAVASAVVREAAGSPILQATSAVTVWATDADQYLDLPGKPVTAVASVTLNGTALATDSYRLVNSRLWRRCGWMSCGEPLPVTATLTHGFAVVPADIVNLVCDVAEAGIKMANSGGVHDPRILVESVDDYSVTFAQGAGAVASVMELPALTRYALRKRFGGGVGVVSSL